MRSNQLLTDEDKKKVAARKSKRMAERNKPERELVYPLFPITKYVILIVGGTNTMNITAKDFGVLLVMLGIFDAINIVFKQKFVKQEQPNHRVGNLLTLLY